MRKDITIVAEPRSSRGKNEARRLRAAGQAPGVLYGAGGEAVPVAVSPKEVNKILHSNTGYNTIFTLSVKGGETVPAMVVDWQNDRVKDNLLHVDYLPEDIPEQFLVDVKELSIGENIRASQIALSGSIKLLSNPEAVIAHVVSLKAEEAPAAEAVVAAPAEPEVAKKGKKEEEAAAPAADEKKKKK